MRSDWKKELSDLQFDYRRDLEDLKKEADKERNLLRFRIAELQNMNKRKIINRQQFEQIKALNEQNNGLQEEMHIREAENIILSQIKDYYEAKLRQAEQQIGKVQLRNTNSVLARKIKRNRFKANQEVETHRVFE